MDRVTQLLAANSRLVLKGRDLKRQLEKARDQFAFYAKEHFTKAENFRAKFRAGSGLGGDPMASTYQEQADASHQKALVNQALADEIQKTLDTYHVVELESNLSAS